MHIPASYTHFRAHESLEKIKNRYLLEKKTKKKKDKKTKKKHKTEREIINKKKNIILIAIQTLE